MALEKAYAADLPPHEDVIWPDFSVNIMVEIAARGTRKGASG